MWVAFVTVDLPLSEDTYRRYVVLFLIYAAAVAVVLSETIFALRPGERHSIQHFIIVVFFATSNILLFSAVIYMSHGLCLNFADAYNCIDRVAPDKMTAIYFSVVTFTTLGYGDFLPTPETRIVALTEAFLGYAMIAYAIGFTIAFMFRDKRLT